jgi:hypothetical protein
MPFGRGSALHPAFCPFCLFDKDLPVSVRMHSHVLKTKFMAHVETHLIAQKDSVLCVCPAAMASGDGVHGTCGETTPMTKVQLKEHLARDHNMMFSLKKPKRANKAGEEGDNEEVEDDEDGGQSIAKENVRPKKKPTREISRQPLQKKDVNQDEVNCTSWREGVSFKGRSPYGGISYKIHYYLA